MQSPSASEEQNPVLVRASTAGAGAAPASSAATNNNNNTDSAHARFLSGMRTDVIERHPELAHNVSEMIVCTRALLCVWRRECEMGWIYKSLSFFFP